tara:strand:- start:1501 stop:2439 length:939 start_codon:yes stop_codon:yes gene_type:complete
MSIYKKILKISFLEILLIVLIICFIINYYKNYTKKEGFIEIKDGFTRMTDNDVFDDTYVNIYDNLVYNQSKNNFEVGRVFNSKTPNVKQKILDIGCATGHHVNMLNNDDNYVIGIDNSPAMIKKAKENYPGLNFKLCDALNYMEFPENTFTHISCLYFTIYYIKDKKQILENCYNWLQPGGVFILHLVDMHNFDPVIPASTQVIKKTDINKNNRNTESFVNFDKLDYKANFEIDKTIDNNSVNLNKSNTQFKETIKFKDPKKVRVNEHNLYISTQRSILACARDIGFILQSQEEMKSINYENNFIYTLQKPE